MSEHEVGANQDAEDELEVSDLPKADRRHAGHASGDVQVPRLLGHSWQRLALGLGLILVSGAVLAIPLRGDIMLPWSSSTIGATLSTPVIIPTEIVSSVAPPTPVDAKLQPTPLPGGNAVPALAHAPASCGASLPLLTSTGPPFSRSAIGTASVLLGGFVGPYATMLLGRAASNEAYGWTAPYSRYGWPAPIGLIVSSNITGPVTLAGWDDRTGYPLWFGFIVAGTWGAPQVIAPIYTLNPSNPVVPVGGSTVGEEFWYGYAFLPGAGCYTLEAMWPGGSWQITVSAGAVATGHP
jgi:hypothetical protein